MGAVGETRSNREAAVLALARLTATLDSCVSWVCIALLAGIFVTMVLQVVCRYVLGSPLVWSEELARYLYIWTCYLGAPIALRRGNHIAITLFVDRLPAKLARGIAVFWHVVAFLFLVELAIQGAILTARSHALIAITIPIPWSLIYLAVPISAVLMLLETAEAIWVPRVGPVMEVQL
jgi:TRAP-type C4-dicarboxylate transport system permease small subunit